MQEFSELKACKFNVSEVTNTCSALHSVQYVCASKVQMGSEISGISAVTSTSQERSLPFGQNCYLKTALYLLASTRETFCCCAYETYFQDWHLLCSL